MASSLVTKEIECRIKQSPERLFEVFLEIHQPIDNEPPAILIQYPQDFSDEILKTAAKFAYPCQIPPDDHSEYFTFVVLDSSSLVFRFGYCRRSHRESTCLCIVSYYPWFEIFCNILNDVSQIINTKSVTDVEAFLLSLYDYKLMSSEEFYKNDAKETIRIAVLSQIYDYNRPDLRRLPSMSSNSNFTIMFSRLGSDLILRLFAHLIFERRIIFVSSELSHLTACACGCLYLIYPMHWQSIFLPVLPESMTWTAQCTAPYILGIHSRIYSRLNRKELGDVIIVNIDAKRIESPYDDLNLFPKHLLRQIRKDMQQSSQFIDDQLARVFLRAMIWIVGNYADGFVIKNELFDFDRNVYLKKYLKSDMYNFMSSIVNTQMFEQFSRYRAYRQMHDVIDDLDDFDIEVNKLHHFHQAKLFNANKNTNRFFEQTTTKPNSQRTQTENDKLTSTINASHAIVTNDRACAKTNSTLSNVEFISQNVQQSNLNDEQSPSLFYSSTDQFDHNSTNQLIDLNVDQNLLMTYPMDGTKTQTFTITSSSCLMPEQNLNSAPFDNESGTLTSKTKDLSDESDAQKSDIDRMVELFDPLMRPNDFNQSQSITFQSETNRSNCHSLISQAVSGDHRNDVSKTIQSSVFMDDSSSDTNGNNLINFD